MMILGLPAPPVRTLSDWLRIATQELTEASKQRVRPEIESHYTQAVEAHRESGLSEPEAQAAALAELGDARAASKRFCRQYLTKWDMVRLNNWEKGARSIWILLFHYFMFWLYVSGPIPFRNNWLTSFNSIPLFLSCAFIALVAFPSACFVFARATKAKPGGPTILLSLLSLFVTYAFLYPCFIIHPVLKRTSLIVNGLMAILYLSFLIRRSLDSLRLWNKLSKPAATHLGKAS